MRSECGGKGEFITYWRGCGFWMMMKNMVVLADFRVFINFVGKCVYADRLRYWVMHKAR